MENIMIKGQHFIAGEWVTGESTFKNEPASGPSHSFAKGTPAYVNSAAIAAEEAFWSYGYSTRKHRAQFLNKIADEIDKRGDDITAIGCQESGLPEARLEGERGRTTGQLRLFADHIIKGDYLDRRHDAAMPDRLPLPRPDLRMMERPVGPVAVFGASNFPLAFSTAGGDTAAALAAGCPVLVKGHSAHPGTADVVAQAIEVAIRSCDVHPGVFSLIQGGDRSVGEAVVKHPLIRAVGFTGSFAGGRALFDLCASRPEPIPFFGELGSVNPIFILPAALEARAADIGSGWAASLTMGVGQFCTKPGIAVVIASKEADDFTVAAAEGLQAVSEQVMLTGGISNAYRKGRDNFSKMDGVFEVLNTSSCALRNATPSLFETTGAQFLANEALHEEVFGPLGMVVVVEDFAEMKQVAHSLQGQLTCTLQLEAEDTDNARALMPVLERKAGRILANGFPTGVEVTDAMVHGGPYPASTNFGATSVGTMSIRRFVRPVCYQGLPDSILPDDLVVGI